MNNAINTYEVAFRDQTTGWNVASNDINGVNQYKMRPIEVAAQAGDVAEFCAIMKHPSFNASGARPRYFAEIGRVSRGERRDERYLALVPHLKALDAMSSQQASGM
jgi:hypothetical protein